MNLQSPAFAEGKPVPDKHARDHADDSPELSWSGAPEGTKSFTLVCDDPDAPVGTWVHWVLYELPATARQLPEGVPAEPLLKDGSRQGTNDFKRTGYGGPCPPPGKPHRYFFRLYALDTSLRLAPGKTKAELLKAMEGHVKGQAELVGRYGR